MLEFLVNVVNTIILVGFVLFLGQSDNTSVTRFYDNDASSYKKKCPSQHVWQRMPLTGERNRQLVTRHNIILASLVYRHIFTDTSILYLPGLSALEI